MYRFSDEYGESPKGVPIPLEACQIRVQQGSAAGDVFELVTLRKTYVIRATSASDCSGWVSALKERQVASIRENMGHAKVSVAVAKANSLGSQLFSDRLRRDQVTQRAGDDFISNPLMGSFANSSL